MRRQRGGAGGASGGGAATAAVATRSGCGYILVGMFLYHALHQAFFLPTSYLGGGCGGDGAAAAAALRRGLHAPPGGERAAPLWPGVLGGAAAPGGIHKALSDFIPDHHAQLRRPSHNCTRWNTTYVFPQAPAFIIIGTQKGGTSALSALLDQHPWVESSHYFEPHFFDFNEVMLHYRNRLHDEEAVCKVLRTYLQKNFNIKRLKKYPKLLAFEKTPAYVLTPNAPARIRAVVPWAKIIVTLRNPVDRLLSQHKMTVMRRWENRTFEETLAADINVMRHEGFHVPRDDPVNATLLPAVPPGDRALRRYKTEGMLYRGCYARQLLPWLEQYTLGKDILVLRYEELKADPRRVLNRVLDFVGAPHYDFPDDAINKSYSPRSSTWIDYSFEVADTVSDYLKRFYKPYNEELAALLGDEWKNVWD